MAPMPGIAKTKSTTNPAPALADEPKYRAKCRQLRTKVNDIEKDNLILQAKIMKAKKNIQRLRLERSILYDRFVALKQPPQPAPPSSSHHRDPHHPSHHPHSQPQPHQSSSHHPAHVSPVPHSASSSHYSHPSHHPQAQHYAPQPQAAPYYPPQGYVPGPGSIPVGGPMPSPGGSVTSYHGAHTLPPLQQGQVPPQYAHQQPQRQGFPSPAPSPRAQAQVSQHAGGPPPGTGASMNGHGGYQYGGPASPVNTRSTIPPQTQVQPPQAQRWTTGQRSPVLVRDREGSREQSAASQTPGGGQRLSVSGPPGGENGVRRASTSGGPPQGIDQERRTSVSVGAAAQPGAQFAGNEMEVDSPQRQA